MDSKTKLLEEVLNLFYAMGVREGQGQDGRLMTKIIAEIAGGGESFVAIEIPKGRCPLCGGNMMDCDCDPTAQFEAAQK